MKRSLRNSILTVLAVLSFGVALSATRLKLPALNRSAAAQAQEVAAVAAGDGDESSKELAPASRLGRDVVLQTDKLDYRAGEVVVVTGSGFEPGETVTLLLHEEPAIHKDRKVAVVADAFGEIFDNQFTQDGDHSGVTFILTAIGKGSGLTTQAAFGNPSATLDQWATIDGTWVNGNLGASKARYFEGDSIPYRLRFGSLPLTSHVVTIEWDTTKADKHALDYLTTFNRSAPALPCQDVAGCGSPTTFPIPVDPQVSGAGVTPVAGNFTLYGGTITSVSAYTYANGTGFTGDKSAQVTITFTASVANPVLSWGGHISTRLDWGELNSCVNISGSPFHTRLLGLNGSGGNQDRSLSSDATIFPAKITIIKQASPEGSASFPFAATPTPLSGFSLVDDGSVANTKVFDLLNATDFKAYTITESAVANWTLDSITCGVTSANGGSQSINLSSRQVSLSLKEGESRSCTFTNSAIAPKLTLVKSVTNNNGGNAGPNDFGLTIGGNATTSGTKVTLNANQAYAINEAGLTGYTFVSITGNAKCPSALGGTVTLAFGDDITCTITNDDVAPKLALIKSVTNDNGGNAGVNDFGLSIGGNATTSGTKVTLNANQAYAVNEAGLTGYTFVSITGNAKCPAVLAGTVTLDEGDDISCTITNDDVAPKLALIKSVTNDNGGNAGVNDFGLSIGGNATTSGTKVTLNANQAYAINEAGLTGYTFVSITGNAKCPALLGGTVTLDEGDDISCTITNNDVAPKLTLIKSVTNNNGGQAGPNDFGLSIGGNATTSGTKVTLNANQAYAINEAGLTGYTFVSITGNAKCPAVLGGTVTLDEGDDISCTITNDDSQRATTIQTIMSWTLKDAVDLGQDLVRGTCGAPGTITFRLYRHDLGTAKADLTCDAESFIWESDELAEVDGAASTSHDVEEDGIYLWVAVYSGDNCNTGVTSDCGREVTEITDEDLTPASASPICNPAS